MEKQKKEIKNQHPRITLLSFFYGLCIIIVISIICLGYVLHLKYKDTDARINELENTIQVLQNSGNNNINV